MPEHRLATTGPVHLHVQLESGDVGVTAVEDPTTAATVVTVEGDHADDVEVGHDEAAGEVRVVLPRRTGFRARRGDLRIEVTLPAGSSLSTRTGSADVRARGRLAAAVLHSGSGDLVVDEVDGPVEVVTGSGDVRLGAARGELLVKTGSGDVVVDLLGGAGAVRSGSGDVRLGRCEADLEVKSGSGDLAVDRVGPARVAMTTASGDVLVGVAAGTPVWTDVSSVSGEVRSTVPPTGEPAAGRPYLELRASTVSGDVLLREG